MPRTWQRCTSDSPASSQLSDYSPAKHVDINQKNIPDSAKKIKARNPDVHPCTPPILIAAFRSKTIAHSSPTFLRRPHPPIANRVQGPPPLSNLASTRDATAAHQATRKHQPTRPRGQPQCTRSSSRSPLRSLCEAPVHQTVSPSGPMTLLGHSGSIPP